MVMFNALVSYCGVLSPEVKMLQGLDQAGPSEQVPTQPAVQHVLVEVQGGLPLVGSTAAGHCGAVGGFRWNHIFGSQFIEDLQGESPLLGPRQSASELARCALLLLLLLFV